MSTIAWYYINLVTWTG